MKLLAIVLALQIAFPFPLFADVKNISLAIIPINDNVSDDISSELTDAFVSALEKEGLYVVAREKVDAVLNYYQRGGENVLYYNDAETALIQAKEHYFNFDYDPAKAEIERSIEIMEAHPDGVSLHGQLLRDAYISAAIIERSEKRHDDSAKEYFRRALTIDPHYQLDEKEFSPSTVKLFNNIKGEISYSPAGSISVETDPKVAEVYLNGILKGVTPLVVTDIPQGEYSVAVITNKYKKVEKRANVAGGETFAIKEKLLWVVPPQNIANSTDEARSQINEGLRIAELIRTNKVIMLDADEEADGSGVVAIRMIDREYRAGQNPIIIEYKKGKEFLVENLAQATNILTRQAHAAILKDPAKNIDPDGIGDPILLGKRRKELMTIPAFWAVVGGALAATAGGVTAAIVAGGGGDTPATGSVNVQFK